MIDAIARMSEARRAQAVNCNARRQHILAARYMGTATNKSFSLHTGCTVHIELWGSIFSCRDVQI